MCCAKTQTYRWCVQWYCGEHVEKETTTCLCEMVCENAMQRKEEGKFDGSSKNSHHACIRLNGVLLQRLCTKHQKHTLPKSTDIRHRLIVNECHFSHRWKTLQHPKGKQIQIASWHPFAIIWTLIEFVLALNIGENWLSSLAASGLPCLRIVYLSFCIDTLDEWKWCACNMLAYMLDWLHLCAIRAMIGAWSCSMSIQKKWKLCCMCWASNIDANTFPFELLMRLKFPFKVYDAHLSQVCCVGLGPFFFFFFCSLRTKYFG